MRILLVNTSASWGGGENWHLGHARELLRRGHEVSAVAAPESALAQRYKKEGVSHQLVKVGNFSWLSSRKRRVAVAAIHKARPDAILVSLPADAKLFLPQAARLGVAKRIYRRGIAVPVKDSWFNRRLFAHPVTHVIVNSEDTRRCLLQNNPQLVAAEKVHLIYNGVKEEVAESAESGGEASLWEGLSDHFQKEGLLRIFHAGRLTEQKGQRYLLEVMHHLVHVLGEKNVGLVIAGEGELEKELKQQVKVLQLQSFVKFVGFQVRLSPWMKGARVFAMPSQFEGFGFAAAEAMLCELPVVAADTSSLKEIVVHGETGLRIPWGDVPAFAEALLQYRNRELARKQGEQGRRRAQELFSFQAAVDRLEALLMG